MRPWRDERRYAQYFRAKWGVFENPYLDDSEGLDLDGTFVSLFFADRETGTEKRVPALDVLSNPVERRVIVEGVPGAGKSTLLKAYGAAACARIVRPRRLSGAGGRAPSEVPFYVQLRKFAATSDRHGGDLARYLIEEILVSGAGMQVSSAREFFIRLLGHNRVLLLLDGLDELTEERYPDVRDAVLELLDNHNPDLPTHRARVIMTCRTQNLIAIRDEWVPRPFRVVCEVAPLRNAEIMVYLNGLRSKFRHPQGPEKFFHALQVSGTLDVHRVPLILAMSVGLFARRESYEIPSSISRLYEEMIREMLDRHRFRRDPGGGALEFGVEDKYRFLREFARRQAIEHGFDEFSRHDLVAVATALAPNLDDVNDPRALVNEILERSGLLSDLADKDAYLFAHRSVQEFLVAEDMARDEDGSRVLLERLARHRDWRQVIVFYAIGLPQREVDSFLSELSTFDPLLACHCLGRTRPSDHVAATVLGRVDSLASGRVVAEDEFAALVAAVGSPRQSVRRLAVRQVTDAVRRLDTAGWTSSLDIDGAVEFVNALAATRAPSILELVPRFTVRVPDDPRLVEPLWRCLGAPGFERMSAAADIVVRLLGLCMDREGFAELKRQARFEVDFLSAEDRQTAYPFKEGLSLDSNLVTLLAWADQAHVRPDSLNRYLEAKAAGRLDRVETDRRRTLSFGLFHASQWISIVGTLCAFAFTVLWIVNRPGIFLRPWGWWMAPIWVSPAPAFLFCIFLLESTYEFLNLNPRRTPLLSRALRKRLHFRRAAGLGDFFFMLGISPLFLLSVAPLAGTSVPLAVAVGIAGSLFSLVLPMTPMCDRSWRCYVYRPNPFIDVYDDPRSRDWLGAAHAEAPSPRNPAEGTNVDLRSVQPLLEVDPRE